MAQFTDELINKIWEKGRKDPKYHPDFVRKDACGAWIIKDKYNDRDSIYGWEVDHIYPESKLKELGVSQDLIDNIANLRPLNWKNNVSKSSDYPHYLITAKPKAHAFKNEMCFPLTKTKCELKKHPNSKFECFFNDFNRTKTSLFLPFPSKLIQDNLVCVLELQE